MEKNLTEFNKKHKELYNDVPYLTYKEVKERCYELWKTIPHDHLINTFDLDKLIHDTFHNDPDYDYAKVFIVPVKKLTKKQAENSLKKLIEKYK